MTDTHAAGAHRAGQATAVASRARSAVSIHAEDMTGEVERLRQRFAEQHEYVQERIAKTLEDHK